jgi:hypothetical protein
MSKKTSTAALESICEGRLPNRRRAPRHPAGERRRNEARKQRSRERAREFGQARIVIRQEDGMKRNSVREAAGKFRVIMPVILRITFCLVMWTLGAMTMTITEARTAPKTSTKKEDNNPQLTSRVALTKPPGALFRNGRFIGWAWPPGDFGKGGSIYLKEP